MKTAHIMVDLETLSSQPNAAIVSIGAVLFAGHPDAGMPDAQFFRRVTAESSQKHGLHVDAGTVEWWLRQSPDAIHNTFDDNERLHLAAALMEFSGWAVRQVGDTHQIAIWGNGATFDNVVLRNAYSAVGVKAPWSYRGDRCYRTLAALAPDVKKSDNPLPHGALFDALAQAEHALRLFKHLGIGEQDAA